jgi:peptidoglycan hydrolase-like protein with peptidoglycan-binding domain
MALLKKGLSGEPVRRLQAKLGVNADGQFGPGTEKALKDWQTANKLSADGIAGPDTFAAMGLHELILLKTGTKGDLVRKLQAKLELEADGVYGEDTEEAVRDYQEEHGLEADGVAGPVTIAHMKLIKEMTPEVVKMSQVPASSIEIATPDLKMPTAAPDLGVAAASPGAVPTAQASMGGGMRSIWDTIKGVFK